MNRLWWRYLDFLIRECYLEEIAFEVAPYRILESLHRIPYRWSIAKDENRAEDGKAYRSKFLKTVKASREDIDEFLSMECSVLEMLIGLAIRIDFDYIGDPGNPHPDMFFLEMLRNLGIELNRRSKPNRYQKKIDVWLDRQYRRDGVGGIFPVYSDPRDQRELETWEQMNAYLFQNYNQL